MLESVGVGFYSRILSWSRCRKYTNASRQVLIFTIRKRQRQKDHYLQKAPCRLFTAFFYARISSAVRRQAGWCMKSTEISPRCSTHCHRWQSVEIPGPGPARPDVWNVSLGLDQTSTLFEIVFERSTKLFENLPYHGHWLRSPWWMGRTKSSVHLSNAITKTDQLCYGGSRHQTRSGPGGAQKCDRNHTEPNLTHTFIHSSDEVERTYLYLFICDIDAFDVRESELELTLKHQLMSRHRRLRRLRRKPWQLRGHDQNFCFYIGCLGDWVVGRPQWRVNLAYMRQGQKAFAFGSWLFANNYLGLKFGILYVSFSD